MTHLSTHQLTERVNNLAAAAKDNGTVTSLVIRPDADEREVVDHIRVVPGEGIVGDNYLVRETRAPRTGRLILKPRSV